ncbi:MAG: delta-60 repeat domain-containing protein [Candidatus Binatia bacterium]|nr:delta-60 repeat domain-containing protein [Candidatus Binatia bacterium]
MASALVLQADGKIVVAGHAAGGFVLVRYQPDGSLDPSFGTGGTVTTAISGTGDFASALAVQADGKLVVAGYVSMAPQYSIALLRYNPDGTLDTAFGENGKVTTGDSHVASGLALQADGKIVVAGSFNDGANNEFLLLRYDPDGGLDPTFGIDGKVTTRMSSG